MTVDDSQQGQDDRVELGLAHFGCGLGFDASEDDHDDDFNDQIDSSYFNVVVRRSRIWSSEVNSSYSRKQIEVIQVGS
jgi:hypothetical protein